MILLKYEFMPVWPGEPAAWGAVYHESAPLILVRTRKPAAWRAVIYFCLSSTFYWRSLESWQGVIGLHMRFVLRFSCLLPLLFFGFPRFI